VAFRIRTDKNVTEVMNPVGYSDTKAFQNTFKKITDLSAIEYWNKRNKHCAANQLLEQKTAPFQILSFHNLSRL